jgi:phytol kinase
LVLSELAVQVTAILGWIALVFISGVLTKHWTGNSELARKVVHIGTGQVIVIAWLLDCSLAFCLTIAGIFTVISFLSYYTNILPMLNGVERDTRGVFYYAVSITLLVGIFWARGLPELVVIGVMVMAWGDGMAALIGQRWGTHKYQIGQNQRSWEGSLAMFLVSYGVVGLVLQGSSYSHAWLLAIPIALVSTVLEAISIGGTDNLTVPIVSALLSYILTRNFQ